MKRIYGLLILALLGLLCACTTPIEPPVEKINIDIEISVEKENYYVGDSIIVDVEVSKKEHFNNVELVIVSELNEQEIIKNVVTPNVSGSIILVARLTDYPEVKSNELVVNVLPSIYESDPYLDITTEMFYEEYEEAINPKDAEFRSLHGLMSGDIVLPDEAPIIASYQPTSEEDSYLRNTNTYYNLDKTAYYITDAYGEIVDVIFEGGGYISLDEVASHLLAFGTTPGNHIDNKSGKPANSIWKEYLRCNNTAFSGDTSRYPYEPALPNISGCGGDLYYYEVDFGTTGTTCDPSYDITVYNNGTKITRGAARLVYTRYDKNKNNIIDPNEKYVFYTYNHYNDFQEYLNYQGGWGEIFGNITGGGTLSSKTDCNPTRYPRTVRYDFSTVLEIEKESEQVIFYIKKEEEILI